MTDETVHIATAAAALADPYAALNQHLHGDGDTAWRTRALAAEAGVERMRAALAPSVKALQEAKRELWDLQRNYWTKDDFLNHAAVQIITDALYTARAALAEGDPR